jgi:hypothetical protein
LSPSTSNNTAFFDTLPALHTFRTGLSCFSLGKSGIDGIGASAALKAMSRHWDDHLFEGHSAQLLSDDIDTLKDRLEIMRAEIMRRVSQ